MVPTFGFGHFEGAEVQAAGGYGARNNRPKPAVKPLHPILGGDASYGADSCHSACGRVCHLEASFDDGEGVEHESDAGKKAGPNHKEFGLVQSEKREGVRKSEGCVAKGLDA